MTSDYLGSIQETIANSKWVWVDYGIACILTFSAILGLLRGFVRETLSLLSWLAAIWVCSAYSQDAATLLQDKISIQPVRLAIACAILFFTTLFVGSLINSLLSQILRNQGLSGADRMLGLAFGLTKGSVLVSVLVLLAGTTHVPELPWWKQSQLVPPFQSLASWLKDRIPPDLAVYINYR
jgi:membrane protein required for colicin V production